MLNVIHKVSIACLNDLHQSICCDSSNIFGPGSFKTDCKSKVASLSLTFQELSCWNIWLNMRDGKFAAIASGDTEMVKIWENLVNYENIDFKTSLIDVWKNKCLLNIKNEITFYKMGVIVDSERFGHDSKHAIFISVFNTQAFLSFEIDASQDVETKHVSYIFRFWMPKRSGFINSIIFPKDIDTKFSGTSQWKEIEMKNLKLIIMHCRKMVCLTGVINLFGKKNVKFGVALKKMQHSQIIIAESNSESSIYDTIKHFPLICIDPRVFNSYKFFQTSLALETMYLDLCECLDKDGETVVGITVRSKIAKDFPIKINNSQIDRITIKERWITLNYKSEHDFMRYFFTDASFVSTIITIAKQRKLRLNQ